MYFITYNYWPLNYRVIMQHRHKQQSLNAIKLATLSSSTFLPTVAGVDIFILSNHVPPLLYPLSTFDDRIKKEGRRPDEKKWICDGDGTMPGTDSNIRWCRKTKDISQTGFLPPIVRNISSWSASGVLASKVAWLRVYAPERSIASPPIRVERLTW